MYLIMLLLIHLFYKVDETIFAEMSSHTSTCTYISSMSTKCVYMTWHLRQMFDSPGKCDFTNNTYCFDY